MSQVINLFPHQSPLSATERGITEADTRSESIRNARADMIKAIRYCLESLLQDAEAFDLVVTRAALKVAIAGTLNEPE